MIRKRMNTGFQSRSNKSVGNRRLRFRFVALVLIHVSFLSASVAIGGCA